MRDFIGYGIAEQGPNKNVINILRVLVEDKDSTLYVPSKYLADKPGKGKDSRVHFPPKDSGRPMQVINILSHQERFNFSLQCLVDVKVEYTDNGVVTLRDRKVWRTYHVIRDGELVMPEVIGKLSESAYNDLKAAELIYIDDTKVTDSFAYDCNMAYTIRLTDIPLLSPNWARPNALNFHEMLRDCQRASEQLKQMKKILKESNEVITSSEPSDIYTESISDYSSAKSGKSVECVTYSILERPGYKTPKYEGIAKDDIAATTSLINTYRFKCACIKWAIESAMSHRRSPYTWSEEFQKKANSPRYYSEAIVFIDDAHYRLERCRFVKEI